MPATISATLARASTTANADGVASLWATTVFQAVREAAQAEARAKAAEMLAEKNGALMSSGHPDHAAALAKWQALVAKL
jgi:polysaccharide deacetylase 2 family uncharacterized protein YibQ